MLTHGVLAEAERGIPARSGYAVLGEGRATNDYY